MKIFYAFAFLLIFPLSLFSQELELELELIADGFSSPLELKHAGDDRLFVVERGGQIKIINPDGTVNSTPFLNISSIVGANATERGLLGLAFHPDYANNGYFYVYYTNLSGNTQVSRFTVSSDPDIADPASELQILGFNQPYNNHNGGHLAFGPDGMLYIASGDGGSGGDPENNSQNLTNLLGKLLRLDVDAPAPYIPADNPFVDNSAAMDEIWAYGLRNPWKFSFDPETDDLWIADVGQNAWEEVNKEPANVAGLNYGWRCYEGNAPFNTNGCPPESELTFPIAVYTISGNPRCAITGGYVYRGNEYPAIYGLYFFADACTGDIGTVNQNGDLVFHGNFGASSVTSFGVDKDENLYVVAFSGGSVYKLKDNTPMSVDSHEMENIVLYPNLASEYITLDFGNNSISEVSILDINGSFVNTINNSNNKSLQVDVSNLSSGVYFVKLTNADGKSTFKKLLVK